MITFVDQRALDRYVTSVIHAHLNAAEETALGAVDELQHNTSLADPAVQAIKIAVRVCIAVQRASLALPLPVVPR